MDSGSSGSHVCERHELLSVGEYVGVWALRSVILQQPQGSSAADLDNGISKPFDNLRTFKVSVPDSEQRQDRPCGSQLPVPAPTDTLSGFPVVALPLLTPPPPPIHIHAPHRRQRHFLKL